MTRIALAFAAAMTLTDPAAAQDAVDLEIGYMPILPVSQLFVTLEEGWMEEAGINADLVQFQNGPAMVQALLSGQLDVAYFGIGPAMVARGRGVDIKVVASDIVEQISFVALPSLAKYIEGDDVVAGFEAFAAAEGHPPRISTFPVGSVPETVLQYWIREQLDADPGIIEPIYQGTSQVQQSLLTGAVDGAAILEPVVSTTLARVEGAEVLASGSEMFPDQPGAVLAVREGAIAENRDTIVSLVAAHIRATELLRADPAAAAPMVGTYVGGGRLDPAILEDAITRSKDGFVSDPNEIVEGTRVMHDFQSNLGTLTQTVDLDALFDLSIYDDAVGR